MTPGDKEHANHALRRLQSGDRSAAETLFRLLWPVVSALTRRMLHDQAQAQDVAQESILKLFAQAGQFRQDGDALAWALAITGWECRSELRRQGRQRVAPPLAPSPNEVPSPDGLLEAEHLRAELRQALDSLSDADRQVIESLLDGTYPPQADAAHRKRKQRALERLRRTWRALYFGTE